MTSYWIQCSTSNVNTQDKMSQKVNSGPLSSWCECSQKVRATSFKSMVTYIYWKRRWPWCRIIYTQHRANDCAIQINDLIDRAESMASFFPCSCSSAAYWLMPFLSKWSSVYLPLDDQISGFSYFLGWDKPSFPVVMVHSACPLWRRHIEKVIWYLPRLCSSH